MLDRIGKYQVRKLLGRGATGSVYLATDPFSMTDVAVKVLDSPAADPEEARRQTRFFQNESSLAGKLRHPHIVSILDAGVDVVDGQELRYLVMEVLKGTSLAPLCEPSELLPPARVAQIAYKCCRALEYANSVGVVHRDIKPANIMITDDYDIKVADFGAAQVSKAEVTQVSGVGSPAYMSPEQIRGEEIDFRSDMFSLGAVIYHMLTGYKPFSGGTAFELMEAILQAEPPPPSELRQGLPPEFDAIVRRALGKTRDSRYASWEEFAQALEPHVAHDREDEADRLSDVEEYNAMRRLGFFRRFDDSELWEVVRIGRCTKYAPGTTLIEEGTEDDHVFVVATGLLKVTQRGKLLNAVSPGECVGEMAYARRGYSRRSATVTAVEPSWTLSLRVADIDALSEPCRARFTEAFLSIMADRISMLGGRLLSVLQEQKIGLV